MGTTFKIAEPTDIEMLVQFMREYCDLDHHPFEEQTRRQVLVTFLETGSLGRLWVILSDGEAVGYLILTLGFSFEYGGYDAFIDEVYIRQSHRGKGIGAAALSFAEEACRAFGVRALHLEVERENTNAHALYRKVGFIDHDRYLMTKLLGPL